MYVKKQKSLNVNQINRKRVQVQPARSSFLKQFFKHGLLARVYDVYKRTSSSYRNMINIFRSSHILEFIKITAK